MDRVGHETRRADRLRQWRHVRSNRRGDAGDREVRRLRLGAATVE